MATLFALCSDVRPAPLLTCAPDLLLLAPCPTTSGCFHRGHILMPNLLLLFIEPVLFTNFNICGRILGKIEEFGSIWMQKITLPTTHSCLTCPDMRPAPLL
jgi:hypothetical protein